MVQLDFFFFSLLPVIGSSERGAIEGIVVYVRHHGTHARMRGMRSARKRRPQSSEMMEVSPGSQRGRSASIASHRHRRSETSRDWGSETSDSAGGQTARRRRLPRGPRGRLPASEKRRTGSEGIQRIRA